jgi:glycosyltransferase involved in cell wall biosynthesis
MLAHHIRRSPGTITHFFLPMAYLVGMGTALAVGRPGPLVMSRRSLNLYQKNYPIIAAVERRLHRRADMVLANSAAVATQLRDEEGARADRLRLIYNGIDIEPFADERGARRTAMRAALGLADDVFVMAKVANLIPYKGHIGLLDALALVGDRLPESWRLLMIGRDQGTQGHLEAHAAALGVAAHICWLGERLDVPDLLLASDLGLLVSHEEGFSNVVLEGMAAGLSMVVTDVGGNAEAVVDGETGLVVPPNAPAALADAIATLAANPVLARKYGAAGRDRVKRCFSLDACIDSYERMYAALSADGGC